MVISVFEFCASRFAIEYDRKNEKGKRTMTQMGNE